MALTLPDEVAWVLDLLGYSWPDADEDKIHEAAEAWRQFATAVDWGRYAELFEYAADDGRLRLPEARPPV